MIIGYSKERIIKELQSLKDYQNNIADNEYNSQFLIYKEDIINEDLYNNYCCKQLENIQNDVPKNKHDQGNYKDKPKINQKKMSSNLSYYKNLDLFSSLPTNSSYKKLSLNNLYKNLDYDLEYFDLYYSFKYIIKNLEFKFSSFNNMFFNETSNEN